MVRFEVPYAPQENKTGCGIASLKMALEYLGISRTFEELEEVTEFNGGGLTTTQIAYAASKANLDVKMYSMNLGFSEEVMDKDFYEENNYDRKKVEKWIDKVQKTDAERIEKTFDLQELLSLLNEDTIAVILLDWSIIENNEGYQGHFVPITGYNKEEVLIHDPDNPEEGEHRAIDRETFENSRKSEGTFQDFVLISKKA